MENQRGAAQKAEAALVAAGHRVHRCHHADDRGFPCVGITEPGGCPVDGRIDVAVVVRPRVDPRAAPLEEGVSCAIRAGIPLVEQGPDLLDPYGQWVAKRVSSEGDLAAACDLAAEEAFDPLRNAILDQTATMLRAAGISPDLVTCRIAPEAAALRVWLHVGAQIDRRMEQALAVRVLDAVRAAGRTYGQVDVEVVGTGA